LHSFCGGSDPGLDRLEALGEEAESSRHPSHRVVVASTGSLDSRETATNLLPTRGLLVGQRAAELLQFEEIVLGSRGQRLRLADVVIIDQTLQLLGVHRRDDSLGQSIHVPVASLELEARLDPEAVIL